MLIMIVKTLLLLGMFLNKIYLNSLLLNEALTLKVLIICKTLLNIMDKTVIYQLPECVSSNVIIKSLIRLYRKNSGFQ